MACNCPRFAGDRPQIAVLPFEALDACVLRLAALVERLDGSESDSMGIDRVVCAVGVAESERRIEVLRHRPEVPHGGVVALVRPGRDRKRC